MTLRDLAFFDLIDIAVVAMVVYGMIRAFRTAESRLVLVGLLVLVPLFLGARVVGLRLLSDLFEVFFPVLLVVLVVLFQEDLRRFLERIGAGSIFRRNRGAAADATRESDILVRALTELAKQRIGALVVLEGEESIGRHLSGGERLDAVLSFPLLKSLFDPHSEGHDGALVVSGGRVRMFAAHLPLSDDQEQLDGRGTRHAAALGLSEHADALCLVASEERGTISVADRGKLRTLPDEGELTRELERFRLRVSPPPERHGFLGSIRRRLPSKALSLFVAVALWFLVVHEGTIEYRSFLVPIRTTGRADVHGTVRVTPDRVRVIVSGPRRAFYFVDPGEITVVLTLFGATEGDQRITLTASDLTLPRGVEFVNIVPREVSLRIE